MAKNLLLVSLDTLRADVAYSGKLRALESLRSRGTAFRTTVSSSPLTPVSHATVLTGVQPPSHCVRHLFRERLDPEIPTLATVLSTRGYACGAVVSSPGLNRWYGFDRGFDFYDDWVPPLPGGQDALHVVDVETRGTAMKRAPDVVERSLSWLRRQRQRPIFLFAHFFDAHWPYDPPESFDAPTSNPYEAEAAFMDHYLGTLLDEADAAGLRMDETLVVCFSDHGEDLGGWYQDDHSGDRGHDEERGHGCLLYDTTQLVPLVLAGPGIGGGIECNTQVRLADVMPTALAALDIAVQSSESRSLMPACQGGQLEPLPAYCETFYPEELAEAEPRWKHLRPLKAVRTTGRKTIWQVNGDEVWVFDLDLDPYEKRPLRLAGDRQPDARTDDPGFMAEAGQGTTPNRPDP